jgi:transposase InsO family protein
MREPARGERKALSEKAKFRLKVFDWYRNSSPRFSLSGLPDASITCRRFGIHRSYFYRWKGRYDPKRLSSLENKRTVPKREPGYSRELARAARAIREADPSYSAKKIRPILLRSMTAAEAPSVSTLGRLIAREHLFFRADTKRHKKRSKATRKPYNLKADGARQIIEFDMKHVYLLGQKHYAFCAVDPYTKEAAIHAACSPSSRNATTALEKAAARFGTQITIVNGSENMKDAESYLTSQGITQYWTRPKSPKEKPFVEQLIGTLQRECLDYHYEPMNAGELREVVDSWLDKYHFYRPHEALGFLTPVEFSATLGLSIPNAGVS